MTNLIKPIYEFVLWNNCNNNCSFCFLKTSKYYSEHILSPEEKVKSIHKVKEFIQSDQFELGSHLLLVGGELFDASMTIDVQLAFKDLIELIRQYMIDDKIELLYINTNLMYEDLSPLKMTLLDVLAPYHLLPRVRFTTSYDEKGRYSSEENRLLFLSNIDKLNQEYKKDDLLICVNSILTNDLCNKIISKQYSRKKFAEEHNVFVNLLPYIPYDKSLEPGRDRIIKALLTVGEEDMEYLTYYIDNFLLKQVRHVYEYMKTDDKLQYCSAKIDKCGHYESFKRFQGNDYCFLCDLEKLKNMIS